jgi:hypothetical protein
MYYVFDSIFLSWRNHTLWAEIEGGRPNFPEYKPYWWDAERLVEPLPYFTFMINEKAPKPDNYQTGTEFDLYSPRLINIFREAGIKFETFPARIIDRKSKTPLAVEYEIFHLLEKGMGIDIEKSDFDIDSPYDIRHLVMTEESMLADRLMFRDQKFKQLVLMHEQLKRQVEEVGITGCQYTPIEEYVVGALAWERYAQQVAAATKKR